MAVYLDKLYYSHGQLIAIERLGTSYNPLSYEVISHYNLHTGKGRVVGDFTQDEAIKYIKIHFMDAVAVKPESIIEIMDDMGESWGYANSVAKAKESIYGLAKNMPNSVFYLFKYKGHESFAKAKYDEYNKRVVYDDGKLHRLYADGRMKSIDDYTFPTLMRYW